MFLKCRDFQHIHAQTRGGATPALVADLAQSNKLRRLLMEALDTQVYGQLPLEHHAIATAQHVLRVAVRRDAAYTKAVHADPESSPDAHVADPSPRTIQKLRTEVLSVAFSTAGNTHYHQHMATCLHGPLGKTGCRLCMPAPHGARPTKDPSDYLPVIERVETFLKENNLEKLPDKNTPGERRMLDLCTEFYREFKGDPNASLQDGWLNLGKETCPYMKATKDYRKMKESQTKTGTCCFEVTKLGKAETTKRDEWELRCECCYAGGNSITEGDKENASIEHDSPSVHKDLRHKREDMRRGICDSGAMAPSVVRHPNAADHRVLCVELDRPCQPKRADEFEGFRYPGVSEPAAVSQLEKWSERDLCVDNTPLAEMRDALKQIIAVGQPFQALLADLRLSDLELKLKRLSKAPTEERTEEGKEEDDVEASRQLKAVLGAWTKKALMCKNGRIADYSPVMLACVGSNANTAQMGAGAAGKVRAFIRRSTLRKRGPTCVPL